jgi:hypothetical protein
MTVLLVGTGGLFTIEGRYLGFLNNVNGFRNNVAPSPASDWGSSGYPINDVNDAFNAMIAAHSTAQQPLYDGIRQIEYNFQNTIGSNLSSIQTQATSELIAIVNLDTPQPNNLLYNAMAELIVQMVANSQTVQANTVSATVAAVAGNVTTDVIVASLLDGNGATLEYCYAETMLATVTNDSITGAQAGSEPIQVQGAQNQASGFLAQNWPSGSASTSQLTVTDPNISNGNNLLNNSNFTAYTSNLPNQWNILVGTAGTTIFANTSTTYGPAPTGGASASLQITGTAGAELTSIAQTFNSTGGTTTVLQPQTVYAVNWWISVSATPAAGVLQIDLVNGSNTIITDNSGNNNSITKSLTAVTSTWIPINGMFRLPTNVPSTVKIRIHMTTAIDNGKSVYIDFGAMAQAVQAYTGGPFLAAFRGGVDPITGDAFTISITNNLGGRFQTGFWRFFNMPALGLKLPSSNSPTISDTLVS